MIIVMMLMMMMMMMMKLKSWVVDIYTKIVIMWMCVIVEVQLAASMFTFLHLLHFKSKTSNFFFINSKRFLLHQPIGFFRITHVSLHNNIFIHIQIDDSTVINLMIITSLH
jgi:hypothetical protein